MIRLTKKHAIIEHKESGKSNREVAKLVGVNRKTVADYWNEHQILLSRLANGNDIRSVQEAIVAAPKYDTTNRSPRKYTDQLDAFLDSILESESEKSKVLGNHKQKLTNVQIHAIIKIAGFDIGLSTIGEYIKAKRARQAEVFIKQEYELGMRLEYDFGEVKLKIGGVVAKYHMAVLSSPAASFRWAFLYTSQKKEVFMDSHVKFFELAKGVYEEVVYDNMKNVVTKFIGRNEKQLNEDLIKMSIYYGFRINVTNCFSGNEKGHVESSVKEIRNKVFAIRYSFDSLDEAKDYLAAELCKMNENSKFSEEKACLLPYKPPLELAKISEQKVDKYCFVRVDNNFYSVPEYMAGRKVLIKNYLADIIVYSGSAIVCSHRKKEGFHEVSIDINHYLTTLLRKPGALRNSLALKSKMELKTLFDKYYIGREREFISILIDNKEKDMEEVKDALILRVCTKAATALSIEDNIIAQTKLQLQELSSLFMNKGDEEYVH